jgi:hypothetical protein
MILAMRVCGALLALAACNEVYGLDGTKPLDARVFTIDAPPDLNDEDGDTVPNNVDNCPGIPNKDQADMDIDRVGDACDRSLDGGNDRIVERYMFNQPMFDREDWVGKGWDFRDGYIERTNPDPTVDGAYMLTKIRPEGRVITVEVRMTITQFERIDGRSSTQVIIDGFAGPTCVLAYNATTANTSAGPGSLTGPAIEAVPFTLRAIYQRNLLPNTVLNCRIGSMNSAGGGEMIPPEAVGLGTRGNTAKIEYVVIYASDF